MATSRPVILQLTRNPKTLPFLNQLHSMYCIEWCRWWRWCASIMEWRLSWPIAKPRPCSLKVQTQKARLSGSASIAGLAANPTALESHSSTNFTMSPISQSRSVSRAATPGEPKAAEAAPPPRQKLQDWQEALGYGQVTDQDWEAQT